MEKPVAMLPQIANGDNTLESDLSSTLTMDDSLISVLQGMRCSDASKSKVSKRKKLNVEPGKSVVLADFPSTSTERILKKKAKLTTKKILMTMN